MSGLGAALSVLMVGHSLFGPTAPSMLEQALLAGTGQGTVAAQIINGAPLQYQWDNGATAEGVNAREVLATGEVTTLVLTEAVPLANHLQWSDSLGVAARYAALASDANPQARVFVQETWHSLKSGTGAEVAYDAQADMPWRTRLQADLAAWESITTQMPPGVQATLIPAGQAMGLLYDRIEAQEIPGLTGIEALFSDDIHLNDTGHYFVTMVQYASLTGLDPLGLPRDFKDRFGRPFDTPGEDLARTLQKVAWDAVRAYGRSPAQRVTPAGVIQEVPEAPTALPQTPVPELVQSVPGVKAGAGEVAIGLASITDWSTQQPFLNVMKTARPWIGHRPKQWGGMEYEALQAGGFLDADGWPIAMPRNLSSIGTLVLTDMPEAATSLAGRYRLRFEGSGVIEVKGRAQNIRYGKGEVQFDYEPGPGSVDIRIQRINRADPPRDITLVKLDHTALFDSGAPFNPAWTDRLGPFEALRFMDWFETNNATLSRWEDRPTPGRYTYAPGVPIETAIALANTLGKDAWFNMPHLADDDFVRRFGQLVRDQLDPSLTVYVEFSNEVWNWQFAQARWADEQALARWDAKDTWMQFYGLRAAEVAAIWSEVFAGAPEGRLVNVISSQTGWLGLEEQALSAPRAVAEGLPPPSEAFDAYAVTGYFGGVLGLEKNGAMVKSWLTESADQARAEAEALGLSGEAAAAHLAAHRFDFATALAGRELLDGSVTGAPEDTLADLLGRVLPHHAQVARAHGLDLIMYEGGSHVVGLGPQVEDEDLTAFFHHLNYSAEMGALYATLLDGWQALGGQMFNAYSDVYAPSKWGSWGALRHLDDDNPRYQALVAGR